MLTLRFEYTNHAIRMATGGFSIDFGGLSDQAVESDFPISVGMTDKSGNGQGIRECHQRVDQRTIQNEKIADAGKALPLLYLFMR